jgi:hypothetical protein
MREVAAEAGVSLRLDRVQRAQQAVKLDDGGADDILVAGRPRRA